jgi:nicotinamidase-related amidase
VALSTIDPNTALVVVDLQKGVAALPVVHPISDVAANAGRLAAAFRVRGLPIALVRATGTAPGRTERSFSRAGAPRPPADAMDLMPELDLHDTDHEVFKQTWGAFLNTGLDQYLRNQGVTQVVIAGVATSFGVESTARQAYEHGYHVTLAVDAMTDLNAETHENSVARIFPALGETGTTGEILELLEILGVADPADPR